MENSALYLYFSVSTATSSSFHFPNSFYTLPALGQFELLRFSFRTRDRRDGVYYVR